MSGVFGVATGADMLVWVALIWAAFRVTHTVALLVTTAGRLVATAVRRHRARRQLADTVRKWQALRARLELEGR